jgi:hypothetical protein
VREDLVGKVILTARRARRAEPLVLWNRLERWLQAAKVIPSAAAVAIAEQHVVVVLVLLLAAHCASHALALDALVVAALVLAAGSATCGERETAPRERARLSNLLLLGCGCGCKCRPLVHLLSQVLMHAFQAAENHAISTAQLKIVLPVSCVLGGSLVLYIL